MTTLWSAMIGVFLGFVFGVGCALAVMYSIYIGGYRAAIRDSRMAAPPERFLKAMARAEPSPEPFQDPRPDPRSATR